MYKEIMPSLYQIEITLPKSPLRAVNCYLIKGKERFLLIDTGMNRDECRRDMFASLKELGVEPGNLDLFVTHLHIDHLGLMGELTTGNSTIYFNRREATMLDFSQHWEEVGAFYRLNGFPLEIMEKALEGHPGYTWAHNNMQKLSLTRDGDAIEIGDYCFKCVETPGHSPGHMCLYEPDKKFFISGDHILYEITPNVSMSSSKANPLKDYLASLDKVYALDIKMVLPGHGRIFGEHRKRIAELKQHHRERMNEILSILNNGRKNAYRISSLMSWDVEYGSFDEFPAFQKWFAMGEALSHLRLLGDEGLVKTEMHADKIIYTVASSGS